MFLKRLEIQGFKSFAKNVVLEFPFGKGRASESITAVVGPNGSGKSNIVDAVRWVMGEQSLKTLRGKKSEDVIFSGSASKGQLGAADVSLVLDNTDGGVEDIAGSEIVLTRRIYRNGESEYCINGQQARLQDFTMLLAKSRIGGRSYSVIGQGMIDAVLLATPRDRKEFFDEATGIRPLEIRRDQARRKLEATETNIRDVTLTMNELEPRVRLLGRQMKRLERRQEVEQELLVKALEYYGGWFGELKTSIERLQKEQTRLSQDKKNAEGALASVRKQFTDLEKTFGTQPKLQGFHEQLQEAYKKKQSCSGNLLRLQEEYAEALRAQSMESREVIPAQGVRLIVQDIEEALKGWSDHASTATVTGLVERVRAFVERLTTLLPATKRASRSQEELQTIDVSIKTIEKEIAGLDNIITHLNTQMKEWSKADERERGQLFELERTIQQHQQSLNVTTRELERATIELTRDRTQYEDAQRELREEYAPEVCQKVLGSSSSLSGEGIGAAKREELRRTLTQLRHQLEMIGSTDQDVVKEYTETKERFDFLTKQSEDLTKALASLREIIEELDETMKKQFHDSFGRIAQSFSEYFVMLFGGGKAQLKLIKEQIVKTDQSPSPEPSSTNNEPSDTVWGIEIEATPPGKKLKGIGMLSGGERALTSIALLAALIAQNASPFVLLDEVDAALDEANSMRFAQILEHLGATTQFIVITHNRAVMEKAHVLYGITMGDDGVSKVLSLKLEEAKVHGNR